MAAIPGPASLGGYTVLRALERGAGGARYLGRMPGEQEADPVVLEVVADADAALRQAEALDRAAGGNVVRLLDLADVGADMKRGADMGRGVCLVMEHLPGGTLAEMLARRQLLQGGEAVTILAPLAGAVGRMHAAGVAHGALSAANVRFASDGSPTLTGFSNAACFNAGAPEVELEQHPGVVVDRAALRAITADVLAAVTGPRMRAAIRVAAELARVPDAALVPWCATQLPELASPQAVRWDDEPTAADPSALDGAEDVRPLTATLVATTELLELAPMAVAKDWLLARWRGLSTGRRRMLIALAAGASVIVVGMSIAPGSPAPQATGAAPVEASGPPTEDVAAPLPDDPAAAAAVLLAARDQCFRDLSLLCLSSVEQDGSSALSDDQARIGDAQRGAELRLDPLAGTPTVMERLGDSAIIGLGGGDGAPIPALLLVRTDAGWRIRDLIQPPVVPTPVPSDAGPSRGG